MIGNKYFDGLSGFVWNEDAGVGYLPLEQTPYDQDYFDKYVGYSTTAFGVTLNLARSLLVNRVVTMGSMVDVGIGSGHFMDTVGCYGYDINPVAVTMLEDQGMFLDPFVESVESATFWDSLEHIGDIEHLLKNVRKFAIVSIPIFTGLDHVLRSKHFRRDEHCWYFTDKGFKKFMDGHGFQVIEQNRMETELGREDIGTYICKRAD